MARSVPDFGPWFETITGTGAHPWQRELAEQKSCDSRVIRIPTGFGKTAGTVLAWAYHRLVRADSSWPNRLVFCLPMRPDLSDVSARLGETLGRELEE